VFQFLGSPERLLVDAQHSGGEFALFQTTGGRGHTAPRHRRRRASETFIVLDGDILIEAGDERRVAAAGAPMDRAALTELAAGHGIEILGPGLTMDDYES
jgi:hypothetical protein